MSRKALWYVRKDGSKIAVYERPVAGQLRFTASKREALDGKVWWSIYDNEKGDYVPSKYKTRKDCEFGIEWKIQHKILEKTPYDDSKSKNRTRQFTVEVIWDVHRCFTVETTSRAEAQKHIQDMIDNGKITAWGNGCVVGTTKVVARAKK